MEELKLNDRDIFALYNVLNVAIDKAEVCFEGNRHARIVFLQLQEFVEKRINAEGKDYAEKLRLNL